LTKPALVRILLLVVIKLHALKRITVISVILVASADDPFVVDTFPIVPLISRQCFCSSECVQIALITMYIIVHLPISQM
jgi:hypothetical protein